MSLIVSRVCVGPVAVGDRPREKFEVIKEHKFRLLAPLFLLYLSRLVAVGRFVGGQGFDLHWPTPRYELFPFPYVWEGIVIQIVVPLSPADTILYVVFVGVGIWFAWTILTMAYIVLPVYQWIREKTLHG